MGIRKKDASENLSRLTYKVKLIGRNTFAFSCTNFFRFQKIVWGSKYTDSSQANGVVVCGTDKGGIEIYDPDMILASNADCLVLSTSKHTGPVRALDFNAFQVGYLITRSKDMLLT